MDTTTPSQNTAIFGQKAPAIRLATVMREARRLAVDIRRTAETTSGCGDHRQLTRHHKLAEARKVLDPDYIDALRTIILSLDRRMALRARAPTPSGAILDAANHREPEASDAIAAATLVELRARAVTLLGAIEYVLDDVMAEHAIAELRFFPCFSTAPASLSAAALVAVGMPGGPPIGEET